MKILAAIVWLVLSAALFWAGYERTRVHFEQKLIPYPFEWTGIAVGAALFFLWMAIGFVVWGITARKK